MLLHVQQWKETKQTRVSFLWNGIIELFAWKVFTESFTEQADLKRKICSGGIGPLFKGFIICLLANSYKIQCRKQVETT